MEYTPHSIAKVQQANEEPEIKTKSNFFYIPHSYLLDIYFAVIDVYYFITYNLFIIFLPC